MNQQKWFSPNSFSDNYDYAEKVLKRFNLDKYHFAYDSGELSLLIESGLKKYKVIVDELECLMKIYRCDVHVNFGKHTKENLVLKKTFNDDCIWNSIKWIAKDSKL